jgi:protein-L-isoaspartate O-methyltransferase
MPPIDRIELTAAPPEGPQALIDPLANGGRLVDQEGKARWCFVPMAPGRNWNGRR